MQGRAQADCCLEDCSNLCGTALKTILGVGRNTGYSTGYRALGTRYSALYLAHGDSAGCWVLGTEHRTQGAGHRALGTGY